MCPRPRPRRYHLLHRDLARVVTVRQAPQSVATTLTDCCRFEAKCEAGETGTSPALQALAMVECLVTCTTVLIFALQALGVVECLVAGGAGIILALQALDMVECRIAGGAEITLALEALDMVE